METQLETAEIFQALDVGVELGVRFPRSKIPSHSVPISSPEPVALISQTLLSSPLPPNPSSIGRNFQQPFNSLMNGNFIPSFTREKPQQVVAFIRFRSDIARDLYDQVSWTAQKSSETLQQPISTDTVVKNDSMIKRFFDPLPVKTGIRKFGSQVKKVVKGVAHVGANLVADENKSETHQYRIVYHSVTVPGKGTIVFGKHEPLDAAKDPLLYEIGFGREFEADYIRMLDPATPEDYRMVYIIEFLVENYSHVPFAAILAKELAMFILIRIGGQVTNQVGVALNESPAFAKYKARLEKLTKAPVKADQTLAVNSPQPQIKST